MVEHRLDDARAVLKDACFLLENNGSSQGVVNLAYNSMFYAVLALLQKIEAVPSKNSRALGLFDQEYVRPGKIDCSFSVDIHKAFELRLLSNYGTTIVSGDVARDLVERAQAFIEAAEKLLD